MAVAALASSTFRTSTACHPPPSDLYSVTVSESSCCWFSSNASSAASNVRSVSKTSSCDTTPSLSCASICAATTFKCSTSSCSSVRCFVCASRLTSAFSTSSNAPITARRYCCSTTTVCASVVLTCALTLGSSSGI